MKKKVVYQITRHKFEMIEVETEVQEQAVKELNKDFERTEKSEKTYNARYSSIEALQEDGIDISSNSVPIDETLIAEEEKAEINSRVYSALKILTERQKQVMILHFWEKKTFREIADELGIHFTTVAESYHSALKKMKSFLNKL